MFPNLAILSIKYLFEKYDKVFIFSNLEESSVRREFSSRRWICSIFRQEHTGSPVIPSAMHPGNSSHVQCIPGIEPPRTAGLTEPSTGPPERGPAGAMASWSFLLRTLLTAPSPQAPCSGGRSPKLELHWENQAHSKCSIFIFWLGGSWSPRGRSDT